MTDELTEAHRTVVWAAQEIGRLERERAHYRDALQAIADKAIMTGGWSINDHAAQTMQRIAVEALRDA